jgi:dynein heavy chain
MKKKIVACVRAQPECEVTEDGIDSQIVLLEMAKGVMDMLNAYCHSVYLSILTNPVNQRGWSDLISKDLMDKYHVFLANLHVTVGLMRGQTLLPLPPREAVQDVGTISASGSGVTVPPAGGTGNASNVGSKDRVHVLEGAVITWTKQIRHVLKQEPENVFRDGQNPNPMAEIEFWQNRADNLNYIQSQLQMEGVKKVLNFLERNKSTYNHPFGRLTKEVADDCEEANDNVKFLKTLTHDFNLLLSETVEFDKLDRMFDGIFHTILLIWKHSKYYNKLSRLAVLIREICNSVISEAMRYINGHLIF